MDLQTLKFTVNTDELTTAVTAVNALGQAFTKVNKPIKDTTQETDKASKSTKENTSVLQRQNDILKFMTEGYSKGQASVLAYAKASGALTDEINSLGETLTKQRTLMGTDPFDKSIGAMKVLRNEYTVLKEVNRLYNAESELTIGQMKELAREKLRLIEAGKIEGKTFSEIKGEVYSMGQVFERQAKLDNDLTASLKARDKAAIDSAKANAYLEKEMTRVNSALGENKDLTSGTNNAILRFQNALAMSGKTATEQVAALEVYRQKVLALQKVTGNRQVDYLSRALGPQITDIFTGLATGQSPMTVLLQQGGQLRDQFALAGVAGSQMGKMLVEASKSMVSSVKDVALAVGGLMGAAVVGVGNSITKASMSFLGFDKILDNYKRKVASLGSDSFSSIGTLVQLERSFAILAGTIGVGVIGGLVALGVAYKQVTEQERELGKAVTLTGGALGLSNQQAIDLSTAFGAAKGNIGAYVEAITEAAKAGNISSRSLQDVTSAAIALNKAAGVEVAATVKEFSKLGEKPLDASRELAKSTGLLSTEVLQSVRYLEQQGYRSEAAALATRAYADALKQAALDIQKDMGALEFVFKGIGNYASEMWDKILNVQRKGSLQVRLKEAQETLKASMAGEFTFGRVGRSQEESIAYNKEIVDSLERQIAAEKAKGDEKDKNSKRGDWELKNGTLLEKSLTNQQKYDLKAAEFQRDKNAGIISEIEYNQVLLGLKKQIFGEGALPNTMEKVSKEYAEQLKEAQNFAKNERTILKARFDAGIIDRGEFVSKDTALLNEGEKKQFEVIDKFAEKYKAAYEAQRAVLQAKTGANSQDVQNLDATFKDFNKTLESTKRQISDTVTTREAEALISFQKAAYDSTKAYKEYAKAQNDSAINKQLDIDLEKQLAGTYGATSERIKAVAAESKAQTANITKFMQDAAVAEKAYRSAVSEGQSPEIQDAALNAYLEARVNAENVIANARVRTAKAGEDAEAHYFDMSTKRLNAYGTAFENTFTGMADAIVTFVQTGKLSFSGLIDSMLVDLIRFELRQQSLNIYGSMGGVAGMWSAVTGGQYTPGSDKFVGPMPQVNQAMGGAWDNGIKAFAKGGAFTNSIVDSPTLFKFAKGTGMMGEAGPEAIMPLRRGADGSLGVASQGGGSNVEISIINNTNAQATTQETTDARGNRKVEVVIGDMNAAEVQRNGSSSQKAMKSTYGIQPALIRR